MKILYHHRTLGDGAEGIHIREMVMALRELGHDVRVVSLISEAGLGLSPSGKKAPASQRRRWETVSRLIPSGVYELAEIGYNVVGARNLLRTIRRFQPDFIYDRYNSYNSAALRAARRAHVPILLEVNAAVTYERTAYERLQLKLPWLARRYEKNICSNVDHVFAVSTPLREFLVQERGVPAENVSVLPNGANPKTFHPSIDGSSVRQQYGISNCIVIGFVGILRPWHGVDMLIDAFAQLHVGQSRVGGLPLHLLVVGDGPIQNELESEARKKGVGSNVTFTGRVPHEEVCHYVAAMDIAVSPRAPFYASPMKILEYMAMAKPVVAPDMGNIRDIISHEQNGLLFEPESIDSLRNQIDRLLQNPEKMNSIGQAARQIIETQRNWQQNARRVIDLYQRIAGENATLPSC